MDLKCLIHISIESPINTERDAMPRVCQHQVPNMLHHAPVEGIHAPFQQNNRVVFGCCPPVKIAGGQCPGSARVPHSKPRSGPILRMNAAICIYMYTKYANRPGTSRHKWGSGGRVPYRFFLKQNTHIPWHRSMSLGYSKVVIYSMLSVSNTKCHVFFCVCIFQTPFFFF